MCSGLAREEEVKGPAILLIKTSLTRYCSTSRFRMGGLHVCGHSLGTRHSRGLETNGKDLLKTRDEITTEGGRRVLA